jgi:hypothetical protein
MRLRSALLVAGLAITASIGGASAASADPKGGDVFPLVCDNGVTYEIAVNGNGEFTPGHNLAGTAMLIPVAFGEFHSTVTDANGNVIDEEVQPPTAKGSSGKHARATTTSCTFTITDTFDDPDLGLLTFTLDASVTGFVTPVR